MRFGVFFQTNLGKESMRILEEIEFRNTALADEQDVEGEWWKKNLELPVLSQGSSSIWTVWIHELQK